MLILKCYLNSLFKAIYQCHSVTFSVDIGAHQACSQLFPVCHYIAFVSLPRASIIGRLQPLQLHILS